MKKNVLIIGPIGQLGGREIEAGFITYFASFRYRTTTVTTNDLYRNSSFYQVNDTLRNKLNSFKVFASFYDSLLLNVFAFFCTLKIARGRTFIKEVLGIKKIHLKIVDKLVRNNDIILFIGQPKSYLFTEFSRCCKIYSKYFIFRPTGFCTERDFVPLEYIENINKVVFHSESSRNAFFNVFEPVNYTIIDQTTLLEKSLLKIKINPKEESDKLQFLIVSRIVSEKGIEELIDCLLTFDSNLWELTICGIGIQLNYLKNKYSNKNIHFKGLIDQKNILKFYARSDVFVINSDFETGPITGLEAMAAGLNIITNECGAMKERNIGSFFIHDRSKKSIKACISDVIESRDLNRFGSENRKNYQDNYSQELLKNKYLKLLNEGRD
ncbi:MAG: glycosyltransferase family 4 protein [Flavobacteriaceae bacterium]